MERRREFMEAGEERETKRRRKHRMHNWRMELAKEMKCHSPPSTAYLPLC